MKKISLEHLYLKMQKKGLDLLLHADGDGLRIFTHKGYGYIITRTYGYKIPEHSFYINCEENSNNLIPSMLEVDDSDYNGVIVFKHYSASGNDLLLFVSADDTAIPTRYYYLDIKEFRKVFGNENEFTLVDCKNYVKVLFYHKQTDEYKCIGLMMTRFYKEKLS